MKTLAIKTFLVITCMISLGLAAIIGFGYFWYSQNTQPLSTTKETKIVVINSGETFAQIAQKLEDEKIIKSALAFRIWARLSDSEINIQMGKHNVSPDMTYEQIKEAFVASSEQVRILIREGLRREEIANILDEKITENFKKEDFLAKTKNLEGQLFPDTYDLNKNATAENIVKILNDQFEEKYTSLNGTTTQIEKNKILTIASLLEREGINEIDRKTIAGIIQNRTAIGMPLQLDATLQYIADTDTGTTTFWGIPSTKYKDYDSLFNTYKYAGLPPQPICNPGLESINAALNPIKSDYTYYIHANGKPYYAKTYDEHLRNVEKYL